MKYISLISSLLVALHWHVAIAGEESSLADKDIVIGFDSMLNSDAKNAISTSLKLYEKSKIPYFLRQISFIYFDSGDVGNAAKYASLYQYESKDLDDIPTSKIIAEGYIKDGRIDLAITITERIFSKDNSYGVAYTLANLYLQKGNKEEAKKHYMMAYDSYTPSLSSESGMSFKVKLLEMIVSILISEGNDTEATNVLERHISQHSCSLALCSKAALVFKKTNRHAELVKAVERVFSENPTVDNAEAILLLYMQGEEYAKSIDFINANKKLFGEKAEYLLLETYTLQKDFIKASQKARDLYNKTNESLYLGFSAVYEYEGLKLKDKHTLQPIIRDLTRTVQLYNSPRKKDPEINKDEAKDDGDSTLKEQAYFNNFLGYLLIDHDIDVENGMGYVSKAISIDPTSPEYLDSLAWGFYKLGDCAKALETFSLISENEIKNEDEMIFHKKTLDDCKK